MLVAALVAGPAAATALFEYRATCSRDCGLLGLAGGELVSLRIGFEEDAIVGGAVLDGADVASFEAVFGTLLFDLALLDRSGLSIVLDEQGDGATRFRLFSVGPGSEAGFFVDEAEWLAGSSVEASAGGGGFPLERVGSVPEPGTGMLLGVALALAACRPVRGVRALPWQPRGGRSCPARPRSQRRAVWLAAALLAGIAPPIAADPPPSSCPNWNVEACRAAEDARRWCETRDGEAPRPNVVLVVTDDQRADTLHHFPTITDRLVDEGVNFTHGFVPTPLCGPSRASILTGRIARRTGVVANTFEDFDPSSTLAVWLQQAGYRTGLFGKYLNGNDGPDQEVPPGWDRWFAFLRGFYYDYWLNQDGRIVPYGSAPDDYSTDVITEGALEFIAESEGQPFFLVLAPFAPHATAVPAPRHAGAFDALPDFRPPGWLELDVRDKPFFVRWVQSLRVRRGLEVTTAWIENLREGRRQQLASLLSVDEAIARILRELERRGIADDTLVVFLSDNGFHWGEHWLGGKFNAYEPSIRVPLVMRYPRLLGDAPRSDDRLVLNIDLAPTIAELAGAAAPDDLDGSSLADALCGRPTPDWRSDFVFEYFIPRGFDAMPSYAGIRERRWKYVEYRDGFTELYDLERDPAEMQNLLRTAPTDPATLGAAIRLRMRLIEERGWDPVPRGFPGDP